MNSNFRTGKSITKQAKSCPFLKGSDLVALQGIVSGVKILSFENIC